MNNYILTIFIVSHNHEKTIGKCLEGILQQKVNFKYQVYLLDDYSTDNTIQIAEKYLHFFDFAKIISSNKQEKQIKKFIQATKLANTKYICWLDADDYWVYEYKLQVQVNFLEKNTQYVGCFHDALIINENNLISNENSHINSYKYYSQFNKYSTEFYPYQLLKRNIIPTASLLFRNINFDDLIHVIQKYNLDVYSLNWLIHLYIIKNSKFYYFNEPWSVYYNHSKGLSKIEKKEKFVFSNVKIYKALINDNFYKNFKNKIYFYIGTQYEELAYKDHAFNAKYGIISCYYYFLFSLMTFYYVIQRLIKGFFKMLKLIKEN